MEFDVAIYNEGYHDSKTPDCDGHAELPYCAPDAATIPNNPRTLVPVSGKIFLDGAPLACKEVVVTFLPGPGSTMHVFPVGKVDEAGSFKMTTVAQDGAPPWKYKVLVTLDAAYRNELKKSGVNPRVVIPEKYTDVKQTPLAVEVVASPQPGVYDLYLTSEPNR